MYSLLSKRVASKNGFVIVRNIDLISFFLPGNKCFLQGMPKMNNTVWRSLSFLIFSHLRSVDAKTTVKDVKKSLRFIIFEYSKVTLPQWKLESASADVLKCSTERYGSYVPLQTLKMSEIFSISSLFGSSLMFHNYKTSNSYFSWHLNNANSMNIPSLRRISQVLLGNKVLQGKFWKGACSKYLYNSGFEWFLKRIQL